MPRLMMIIKVLTIRVMIGHKEDNNDDSECDNKRDDNKNNIDVG